MAKLVQIAVFVALAAVCFAEPARLRNPKQSRASARQELAEDTPTQTPYPPAGIVPEVAFDLPTKQTPVEPDNTYLPPDNAEGVPAKKYGPPAAVTDDADDVDDVDAAQDDVEVDQTEQPESSEQSQEQEPETEPEQDGGAENNEIEDPQSGRVASPKLQVLPLKSQRLLAQPIRLRSQRLVAQPIYFSDEHGRLFAYNPQFLRV